MDLDRREFACAALASVGMALCPCWALETPPQTKAQQPPKKPETKPVPKSLVSVSAICCGTCQHWKGERELVEKGRRIRCDSVPKSPCYRGAGFKYSATSSAASHGCVEKYYKRWVEL